MSITAVRRLGGLVAALTLLAVGGVAGLSGTAGAAPVPGANSAASVAGSSAQSGQSGARLTELAEEARELTFQKIPYSKGGHDAKPAPLGASVDCSGLVRSLYYWAFGTDIGSGSGDSMVRLSGEFVKTSQPVPGDVVLLGTNGAAPAYHSMVYVGNDNGVPTAVASPTWGEYVKYEYPEAAWDKKDLMGYWHYKGATAADSGPLTGPSLISSAGAITSVVAGSKTVEIKGWAVDRAHPAGSNHIVLVIDGKAVYGGVAQQPGTFDYVGNHGFDVTLGAAPGAHTVTLTSVGVHSTSGLSSHSFSVVLPAIGAITELDKGSNTIEVKGWALDQANPSASNQIVLVVDGKAVYGGTAHLASDIVAFPGQHGFDVKLGASGGTHTISLTSVGTHSAANLTPTSFTI